MQNDAYVSSKYANKFRLLPQATKKQQRPAPLPFNNKAVWQNKGVAKTTNAEKENIIRYKRHEIRG